VEGLGEVGALRTSMYPYVTVLPRVPRAWQHALPTSASEQVGLNQVSHAL
jgi:hypothetical protein